VQIEPSNLIVRLGTVTAHLSKSGKSLRPSGSTVVSSKRRLQGKSQFSQKSKNVAHKGLALRPDRSVTESKSAIWALGIQPRRAMHLGGVETVRRMASL
jgi:hypothetical protein